MASVLVVDDDPANRLLVRTLLVHAGHDVIEAATGTEGLDRAGQRAPDLILLDLSLPEMNGTEFVRMLRASLRTREIAVALYTATEPNSALRDFMEAYSIRALIPKPSEPAGLIAAVALALESVPEKNS